MQSELNGDSRKKVMSESITIVTPYEMVMMVTIW